MWIVRLALRRPYTFVVLGLLLFILGPLVVLRTPTDIFPNINIPVVAVIWSYAGLSPQQMSDRIVSVYERALTTTVNGSSGHSNFTDHAEATSTGDQPSAHSPI
jgi:multidrug efflux pump subunit AcrB